MAGRENSCQQCLWVHQNPGEGRGGQLAQRAGCELESQVLQERRSGSGDQWQKAQGVASKLTPTVWDAGPLAGMTSWSRALLHHWAGAAVFAGLH